MTALSEIARLPQTKEQLNSFFETVKTELLGGYTDLINFKIQIKILSDLVKKINDDIEIKDAIINEVGKSNQDKIKYTERTDYDFSVCNDSVLNDLLKTEKQVKEAIKNRKNFLKAIDPNNDLNNATTVINEDTGEVLNAPAKGFTKVLTVKIK